MGAPRSFALQLLRAALRLAPEETREWAEAMHHELEFIQGEWAALFWALGSVSAIFRECLRGWGTQIRRGLADLFGLSPNEEGNKMNATGKKTLGVLLGMGLALALGVSAFLLRYVIGDMLLAVGVQKTMWSHLLSVVLPTEIIVVVAAIVLWRKQRAPVAVGLLITGVVMAAHIVVSFVM